MNNNNQTTRDSLKLAEEYGKRLTKEENDGFIFFYYDVFKECTPFRHWPPFIRKLLGVSKKMPKYRLYSSQLVVKEKKINEE